MGDLEDVELDDDSEVDVLTAFAECNCRWSFIASGASQTCGDSIVGASMESDLAAKRIRNAPEKLV